jgi:PAS domain S-box-containing protein
MAKKPSYEELERRITALENELSKMRAEKESLGNREQALASVFNRAPVGIGIVKDRLIQFANAKICSMLGYEPDEIMGKSGRILFPDDEEHERVVKHKYPLLNRDGDATIETRFKRKDGTVLDIFMTSSLMDPRNPSSDIISVAIDRTQRKKMEETLRESEERFRGVFESSPTGIAIVDARDMHFINANNSFLRITGYSKEELSGLAVKDITHPDDWEKEKALIRKRNSMPVPTCPFEKRYIRKDGATRWVRVSGDVIDHGKNKGSLAIASVEDITERKKVEESLKDEAIRRRMLVEQSRDGIVVLDQYGKVYEANRQFSEMLGYSADEASQLYVWDWDDQWTREELMEMIRTVGVAGDHFETRHRRKDGSYYDVEISTNGVVHRGKKLVFCVCRDITGRKRAEEALKESEERFRTIIENIVDGVFICDLDGRFLLVNHAAAKNTGYTKKELLGLTVADIDGGSEERDDKGTIWTRLNEGDFIRIDTVHRRKNGTHYPAELHLIRMKLGGEPVLVGVARDVTERQRVAEKLVQNQERLEAAQALAHLGSWELDVITGKSKWSNEMFRLFGMAPSDKAPSYMEFLDLIHPQDRHLIEDLVSRALQFGEAYAGECRTNPERCPERIFEARVRCVKDNLGGETVHLIGTGLDITERKRAEQERNKYEHQLHPAH